MHKHNFESIFFGKRNVQSYEIEPRNLERVAIQSEIGTLKQEMDNLGESERRLNCNLPKNVHVVMLYKKQ